jgi:hypothetical protein
MRVRRTEVNFSESTVPSIVSEQYNVLERIGSGGHSMVYRGTRKTDLSARVAIKVLHQPIVDESRRRHFDRECAALRRLGHHPNIVGYLDAGIADDLAYLVTPLYEGTYADRLESFGRIDPQDVIRVGAQVADALQAAHGIGLLHRDVKPSNVFIDSIGTAVLGDFGAAGLVDARTITGSIALSIAYAAPETLEASEVSVATDLYALGATLYQLVTGSLPFGGSMASLGDAAGIAALVRRVTSESPAPIDVDGAPAMLTQLIMDLLSKRPADRPQSAAIVADRIRGIARMGEPVQRSRRWAPVAAAAFCAGVVGLLVGSRGDDSSAGSRAARDEQLVGVSPPPADQVLRVVGGADTSIVADLAEAQTPITSDADATSTVVPTTEGVPPPTTAVATGECGPANVVLCASFENGLDGWGDRSNPAIAVIESSDAQAASGSLSLGFFPAEGTETGGSFIERSLPAPPGATTMHTTMRVFVSEIGTDYFWLNLLAFTDEKGRDWRINLTSADDGRVRFDMWTSDLAGVGGGGVPTESSPTGQWICVQFSVTPGGETSSTLRLDGRVVAIVAPIVAEPLGVQFEAKVGSIYVQAPSATPDVYFDQVDVSFDQPVPC